jgi:hypothetical protein
MPPKKVKAKPSDSVTLMVRTAVQSGSISASVATLVLLAPTAAALGTYFASLANFIAMYELCRIDKLKIRTSPVLAAATTSQTGPWIMGFVPFGGNAPTNTGSFEGPHSSTLTPGFNFTTNLVGVLGEANVAELSMKREDFTILEAAGQSPGFIPTNSLGTQTSFGTVYYAASANSVALTLVYQIDLTITFRDLYDPTALLKHLRANNLLTTDVPGKPSVSGGELTPGVVEPPPTALPVTSEPSIEDLLRLWAQRKGE